MEQNTKKKWNVKTVNEIENKPVEFLIYPYIPKGECTQMQAPGGVGKTFGMCRIAADLSRGLIPNNDSETIEPKHTLIISAEDRGSIFRSRLEDCGADLNYIHILDDEASTGFKAVSDNENDSGDLEQLVREYNAELVVIDPLHAFIGDIDINRVNIVRPVMQKIIRVAKRCNCAIVIISHVSKRNPFENANNAGLGSVDIVNSCRSVLKVTTDETGNNPNRRCIVHTKSNYAPTGKTLAFNIVPINEDRAFAEWDGYSELTKEILEAADRSKKSLVDYMKDRADDSKSPGAADIIVNILSNLGKNQPMAKGIYSYKYLKDHFKDIITSKTDITDNVRSEAYKRGYAVDFVNTPTLDRFKIKDRGISIIRLADIASLI